METRRERVARGAALLDADYPGWRDLINLDTLDLGYPDHCVLGQLYGGFLDGVWALGGPEHTVKGWAVERGFEADQASDYDALTLEWAELIYPA